MQTPSKENTMREQLRYAVQVDADDVGEEQDSIGAQRLAMRYTTRGQVSTFIITDRRDGTQRVFEYDGTFSRELR